jgi:transcription initiation factor TFIID TATA-box-binding protein
MSSSFDPSEIEKFFLVEDPTESGLAQDLVKAGAITPSVPQDIVASTEEGTKSEEGLVPYVNEDIEIALELFPHIDNVICSFNLKQDIDLKTIAFRARNAEYNPRKVNAVVLRFRLPRSTALVYSNGKVMVTGSRSEEEARTACKKVAVIVSKCNHPNVRFADFKIENIVASTDVRYPVRLEGLAYEHRASCSYEPELFPGLVYRLLEPKISLLIFVSGKVVITGGRNRDDIITAFKNIFPVLHKYRK